MVRGYLVDTVAHRCLASVYSTKDALGHTVWKGQLVQPLWAFSGDTNAVRDTTASALLRKLFPVAPPVPPAPSASITVDGSPSSLVVVQGGSASATITLARTNYTGTVTLGASGLPSGVTASFTPLQLAGAVLTSSVTFTADTLATTGNASVIVAASGSGVSSALTTLALAVSPRIVAGGGGSAIPSTPRGDSVFAATLPLWVSKARIHLDSSWAADSVAWNGNTTKVHGGGGDYYDRSATFSGIATSLAEFSNVATAWLTRAWGMAIDYRDRYLKPAGYNPSPHWSQLDGLYRHWKATGDTASAFAIRSAAGHLAGFIGTNYITNVSGDQRIIGRVLLGQVLAEMTALDQGDATSAAQARARQLRVIDTIAVLSQPDGSFPMSISCGGQINYMMGIMLDALIKADSLHPDARTLPIVLKSYQYLKATQYRAEGSFNYVSVPCNTNGHTVGSTTDSPDLDLFHVSNLAWLAKATGDAQWTDLADDLFADGTKRGYWHGGKQNNELVEFAWRYILLRGNR
jgi:hypothetical protein